MGCHACFPFGVPHMPWLKTFERVFTSSINCLYRLQDWPSTLHVLSPMHYLLIWYFEYTQISIKFQGLPCLILFGYRRINYIKFRETHGCQNIIITVSNNYARIPINFYYVSVLLNITSHPLGRCMKFFYKLLFTSY
jgi:hypothetical protein